MQAVFICFGTFRKWVQRFYVCFGNVPELQDC